MPKSNLRARIEDRRLKKRQGLSYLPGGATKYIDSLTACLEFIEQNKPSQNQLEAWFQRTFQSLKRKKVTKSALRTIVNLRLVVRNGGKFSLSKSSEEFIRTRNHYLIYEALNENYAYIEDIISLLRSKPSTLQEISSLLSEKVEAVWKTVRQLEIRLNWLQCLGYVTKIGRTYELTKEGKLLLKASSEMEEKPLSHAKIQEMIVEIGQSKRLTSEKEYRLNDERVDVVWKKKAVGSPSVVWEIVLETDPRIALSRLKQAREKWRSKLRLVITRKWESKINDQLQNAFNEIKDVVKVVHWKEIIEWYEHALKDEILTKKMGFKSQSLVFRGI